MTSPGSLRNSTAWAPRWVAVMVRGRKATVVNVGDSRAYHVGKSGIRQVTKDHSLVQMMVDRGDLTPEVAKSYPGKNFITRAIGTETTVLCDIFHLDVGKGDYLLPVQRWTE